MTKQELLSQLEFKQELINNLVDPRDQILITLSQTRESIEQLKQLHQQEVTQLKLEKLQLYEQFLNKQ